MHLVDGGRLSIKHFLAYGLVPARADRCTYILYGDKMDSSLSTSKSSDIPEELLPPTDPVQEALDMLLDPVAQNNAQGRTATWFHLSPCQ